MRRFLTLACLAALAACTTDVDVNAPFKERAVIYAVLDASQPTQVVRLQRSFLPLKEKDVTVAAGTKDSTYFDAEAVTVSLYSVASSGKETFVTNLVDTATSVKDSGLFYAPDQVLFKTPPGKGILDNTKLYRIRVSKKAPGDTTVAYANTDLVAPISPATLLLPFRDTAGVIQFRATRQTVTVRPAPARVVRFQINILLPVLETLDDNSTRIANVRWVFAQDQTVSSLNEITQDYLTAADRTALQDVLLRSLNAADTRVLKRTLLPLTIEVVTVNQTISQYVDANNNYSVLTQTKPYYSNISNGLGILGSRTVNSFPAAIVPAFYPFTDTARGGLFAPLKFKP